MPTELVDILSQRRVQGLRRAWRKARADAAANGTDDPMVGGASAALVGPFPGAGPMTDALLDRYYRTSDLMRPEDRERCIITLLTTTRGNAELAMHFYWGLVEGLDVAEMCEILVLVGGYAGISQYNNAVGVLRRVLDHLAALPADSLDPISAVGAVRRSLQG